MKKSILAAAILALGLNAASADVLKVGTHPTFAPFEYVDDNGKAIGFDIELIEAIAKTQGDTVEIVSMPFDGLIPALLTGQIDASITGMTITDERKKRVDFTEGYYVSSLSALIAAKDKESLTDVQKLKGQKICAQIGTTGAMFAEKLSPGNVVALNNQPDAMLELQNGGCVALINDRPVNLFYLQKANTDKIVELADKSLVENADVYGIAVQKGNSAMVEKLNKGLKAVKEKGQYKELHKKYFGVEQ